MLIFYDYFVTSSGYTGRLTNYFRKNSRRLLKTTVLKRKSRLLKVHLTFNFKRGTLFFILHVKFLQRIKLIYSRSLKVLINFVSNYREVFFKPLGTLKPKVWRVFFYKFFKNIPKSLLYIKIRN